MLGKWIARIGRCSAGALSDTGIRPSPTSAFYIASIIESQVDPWLNEWLTDEEIYPVKQLSIDDLSGTDGWWAPIGSHSIYDCAWFCHVGLLEFRWHPVQVGFSH